MSRVGVTSGANARDVERSDHFPSLKEGMEISIESLPFNKKHQLYGNEATFIRDDGTHHKHPRKSDDDNT